MSAKKSMEELSVAELIGKYNMIVPEIQREYVWGLNKNDILNTFINDIKGGVAQSNTKMETTISNVWAWLGAGRRYKTMRSITRRTRGMSQKVTLSP